MKRWTAQRYHIPSKSLSIAEFDALTHEAALEQVNKWNRSLPGLWQYWLVGEGRLI